MIHTRSALALSAAGAAVAGGLLFPGTASAGPGPETPVCSAPGDTAYLTAGHALDGNGYIDPVPGTINVTVGRGALPAAPPGAGVKMRVDWHNLTTGKSNWSFASTLLEPERTSVWFNDLRTGAGKVVFTAHVQPDVEGIPPSTCTGTYEVR